MKRADTCPTWIQLRAKYNSITMVQCFFPKLFLKLWYLAKNGVVSFFLSSSFPSLILYHSLIFLYFEIKDKNVIVKNKIQVKENTTTVCMCVCIYIYRERIKLSRKFTTIVLFFFFGESFNLRRPLLMIALYYQTKISVGFWCRQELNFRFLIQKFYQLS